MANFSALTLIIKNILAVHPLLTTLLGPAWPAFQTQLLKILKNLAEADEDDLERWVDETINLGLKWPEEKVQKIFVKILRQSQQIADLPEYQSRSYSYGLESTSIPEPVEVDVGPRELRQAGVELLEKTAQAETVRESAIYKPAPKETATYVNFTFTDITEEWAPRELPINEGFLSDCIYTLSISIAMTSDTRFLREENQPQLERPEETEEPIDLYVALFTGEGINLVGKPLDILTWPVKGPSSKNAEFTLETTQTDRKRSTWLDIYIYYKTNLLYTARFEIAIQPFRYNWSRDERPITWMYQEDRDEYRSRLFRRFVYVNRLSERALNLAIQSGQNKDEYLLTAFMGRAELPARLTMTRDQLNSHLVEMRKLLDNLRKERIYIEGGYNQAGEYVGDYIDKSGCYNAAQESLKSLRPTQIFNRFMKEVARLGSQFCDNLFSTDSGQLLRKMIQEYLEEGDIVQIWIDKDANDFVYPWTWLYNQTVDPSHRFTVQKELFWGYKYIIEQLPQFPETTGKKPLANEIPSEQDLRVKIGVFDFAKTTKSQESFFAGCSAKSQGILRQEVWDEDTPWQGFLPKCDSQLLYFFSHGHTAKPSTQTSQQFHDMVTAWKNWITQPVAEESIWMKQYRLRAQKFLEELEGPLNLLSETYIKLNYGNLLLRELRQGMNLEQSAPLVFLNMCESAQIFPNISEGLIDIFLKKGARGVIGTEIPMLPHFADLFSRRFFEAFFYRQDSPSTPNARSVGQIMFELRREFLNKGNPLGFAYTLFGDATTRLSRSLVSN